MGTKVDCDQITVNGVTYVRADSVSVPAPNGNRCVIVADRGWIFAGDVTEEDGRIYLDRAVHVFSWSSIGFNGVLENPKSQNVKLVPMKHRVDLPSDAELFRVPVSDDWGL